MSQSADLALRDLLGRAADGRVADASLVEAAVRELVSGEAPVALAGAVLAALRVRGESVDDVVGAARALRGCAERVSTTRSPLVDTCGTGGDGQNTFSISTAAALVAAAAGASVAKHGNRGATGRFGGADVLEELGVSIDLPAAACGRCLDELGMAFLFARRLHPAMRHLAPVRAALGIRTLFNLVGPLTNPAGVRRQVIGVPTPAALELLVGALAVLGCDHVLLIHGSDGVDEISLGAPTTFVELRDGEIVGRGTLSAEGLGLDSAPRDSLVVADVAASAERIRAVLAGAPGPSADVVVANAAAALYVAGQADSLRAGVERAREAIISGRAREVLARLVRVTQREALATAG